MKVLPFLMLSLSLSFAESLRFLPPFFKAKETIKGQIRISFQREADVVVVGGGPAGFSSAVASARQGAKTILVERFGFLGGAGTVMGVSLYMHQKVVGGIYEEVRRRLEERGGLKGNGYDPQIMKSVLYEMAKEAGVSILFNSWALGVLMEKERIESVLVYHNELGWGLIKGKVIIDATGDGDVAVMAGAPYAIADEESIMPLTLCYVLWWQDSWPPLWRNYGAVWRIDPKRVFANQTRIKSFPLNPFALSEAEMEGREEMEEQIEELRAKGYQVRPLFSGPHIGIRESRRIIGQYILQEEDLLEGRMFKDRIALCDYPIDIHYQKPAKEMTAITGRFEKVPVYSIPYRCLLPLGVENLLVAGRCISASREALGSLRIQPTSMAIGFAAGTAGALAIKEGVPPSKIDVKKLQELLRKASQIIDIKEEEKKE